jgi:DNA-binding NarL/FixJ family response regulator
VIDDHRLLLESLAARLSAQSDMEVVATATNADDGLRNMLESRPDICILDAQLPGRGSFEVAAEIRTRLRGTRLLFLSDYLSNVFLEQALRCKAQGYVRKEEPVEFLIAAVRNVAAGKYSFSKDVEARLQYDAPRKRYFLHASHQLSALTNRQLEVLRHLARGASVKEVAKTLHLSQKSVDSHKYRIMHKLGIHDRVHLARYAIREGLMLP